MSRWIDADALEYDTEWSEYHDGFTAYSQMAIDTAPSIDIVRCAECKHNPWDFDRTDYTCVWDDDFADRPQTPDDFCSYGEHKDELNCSEKPNNCEDEPQTDNGIGCSRCEGRYDCYDRDMPHAVHCNNYGKVTDKPQTDCPWK